MVYDLADVFETSVGLGGERAHEVAVAKMERSGDASILSFLWMN